MSYGLSSCVTRTCMLSLLGQTCAGTQRETKAKGSYGNEAVRQPGWGEHARYERDGRAQL